MIFLRGTRRLMNTLSESLILPICYWLLMGIFCYFTRIPQILKEVKSYLESYGSKYRWSGLWWNHRHLQTMKTHLSRFHLNPRSSICIFLLLNIIKNLSLILQTLFSCVILFARVPNASSWGIGSFIFSSPSNEYLKNSINVWNEDMLYNWTYRASMFISKVSKPFKVANEMYPTIV